jgi:Flp pilus assembly protein TadB
MATNRVKRIRRRVRWSDRYDAIGFAITVPVAVVLVLILGGSLAMALVVVGLASPIAFIVRRRSTRRREPGD